MAFKIRIFLIYESIISCTAPKTLSYIHVHIENNTFAAAKERHAEFIEQIKEKVKFPGGIL